MIDEVEGEEAGGSTYRYPFLYRTCQSEGVVEGVGVGVVEGVGSTYRYPFLYRTCRPPNVPSMN